MSKTLLILLISLMLGQSVLASADVHVVFEVLDTHHLEHTGDPVDDLTEDDHSGDDCGHCCHAHGCSLATSNGNAPSFQVPQDIKNSAFEFLLISRFSPPLFRPPIA